MKKNNKRAVGKRHYVIGKAEDPRTWKTKEDWELPDLVLPIYRRKKTAFTFSEGALVYEVHLKKDGTMTD